jgi:hypothetical protein
MLPNFCIQRALRPRPDHWGVARPFTGQTSHRFHVSNLRLFLWMHPKIPNKRGNILVYICLYMFILCLQETHRLRSYQTAMLLHGILRETTSAWNSQTLFQPMGPPNGGKFSQLWPTAWPTDFQNQQQPERTLWIPYCTRQTPADVSLGAAKSGLWAGAPTRDIFIHFLEHTLTYPHHVIFRWVCLKIGYRQIWQFIISTVKLSNFCSMRYPSCLHKPRCLQRSHWPCIGKHYTSHFGPSSHAATFPLALAHGGKCLFLQAWA